MSKKEKRIAIQNDLISRVYDLILDKETTDDERSNLIEFKNSIEDGKDFDKQLIHLAESLRRLAMLKYKDKKTLSSKVGKLYIDISINGQLRKNLGAGMTVLSFLS